MSRFVNMLGPKPTWQAKFEARGRALIGHLLTNPTIIYDPMATSANWLRAGTSLPVVSVDGTSEGGAYLMNTTAVAGQNSDLYYNVQAGASRTVLVKRPSTAPWYQAWRVSIDTAIDNVTLMRGGLIDAPLGTAGHVIGITGSVSTAKFCGVSGANTVLSSVNIALGIFELEQWGVGTVTTQFRVNGESPVSLAYGLAAVDGWHPYFNTMNQGTAAARTWRLLDHLIMSNGL